MQEMDKKDRLYEKIIVLCFVLIVITAVQYFFLVHDVMPFSYVRLKGRGISRRLKE